MKTSIIFIIVLFALTPKLYGQNRIIHGYVLSEDLGPLYKARIQSTDTTLLGETDLDGRFKIEMPQNTQTLFLSCVGMERTNIKLKNDCDTLEIIMIYAGTYDFMSPKKIDRQRLKRFNKLPKLHLKAYEKRLFSKEAICYLNEFEPHKPGFDEIKRQRIKKEAELKQIFERVKIGDTIKIPFNEQSVNDGTGRATLFAYSAFPDYTTYDCIIKGVVVDKNKNHKGYNLVYRVINCDNCKPSGIYNGKTMKNDEVFEHNMRHSKVLIN